MIGLRRLATLTALAAILTLPVLDAYAGTWQPVTGTQNWGVAANWNPAVIPDGVGANATFNNAASGSNPAQTGNRVATVDSNRTIGSMDINQNAVNAFRTDIGGPVTTFLTFDEVGTGPATVTAN